MTSQGYLLSLYYYVIYLKGCIVATSKVAGIGDIYADAYAFPNIDLGGRYGQGTGSKGSASVGDDTEGGKVARLTTDHMGYFINHDIRECHPLCGCLIIEGKDKILRINTRRYLGRVIGEGYSYWRVKCSSLRH